MPIPLSIRLQIPLSIRLQDGKVKGVADIYEQWKNDHAEAMAARDMEDFVVECSNMVQATKAIWDKLWADLNTGMKFDPDGLGKFVDVFFTRAIRLSQTVFEHATGFARETGHDIVGLDNLDTDTAALEELHQRVITNWPWRDRAWPPLDKAMQQRSRSHADGPGEDAEEILRRLDAGEPLL